MKNIKNLVSWFFPLLSLHNLSLDLLIGLPIKDTTSETSVRLELKIHPFCLNASVTVQLFIEQLAIFTTLVLKAGNYFLIHS